MDVRPERGQDAALVVNDPDLQLPSPLAAHLHGCPLVEAVLVSTGGPTVSAGQP
jgi:hypothetical protein